MDNHSSNCNCLRCKVYRFPYQGIGQSLPNNVHHHYYKETNNSSLTDAIGVLTKRLDSILDRLDRLEKQLENKGKK
jgi:hypothetical protein